MARRAVSWAEKQLHKVLACDRPRMLSPASLTLRGQVKFFPSGSNSCRKCLAVLWSVLGPLCCPLSKYVQMSTPVHMKNEFLRSPARIFLKLYIQLHQTEVSTLEVLVQ